MKLLVATAVLVICALGAAEVVRRTRGEKRPAPWEQLAGGVPSTGEEVPGNPEPAEQSGPDYSAIGQRDMFRSLVKAPRGPQDVTPPSTVANAGRSEGDARGPQEAAPGEATAAKAPDPLADLALTGVTQVGDRLQALIERISTRSGRYLAVGEEFDGFRVVSIQAKSVILAKGGEEHTLSMGSKELTDQASSSAPASAQSSQPSAPSATPRPSPGGGFGGGMMSGQFGDDMLAWAERQPLSSLERMYSQYGQYMAPEQREQAERYLEDRRRRGR